MKAVFSYWSTTDDITKSATNWINPKFHLYSWVLAVNKAKEHYNEIELVTDSIGKYYLVDKLGLEFNSVRTDLDKLEYSKEFWALGKIKAYQLQDKPFIHIDNDVILIKNLPNTLLSKPLISQNIEDKKWFKVAYGEQIKNINNNVTYFPSSWGHSNSAINMGVYGCNNMLYNKEYCNQVFNFIDYNYDFLHSIKYKDKYSLVFEQYIAKQVSDQMSIEWSYVDKDCRKRKYNELGYVHIWGGKRNIKWYNLVESIIFNKFKKEYYTINSIIS